MVRVIIKYLGLKNIGQQVADVFSCLCLLVLRLVRMFASGSCFGTSLIQKDVSKVLGTSAMVGQ